MIVVSLLLILVAVTLLVLGLAGGSSPLLISSIVASLLAAVALVIGARQAATRRRQPAHAEPPATRPAPARRGARRRETAGAAAPATSAAFGAEAGTARGDAHSDFSGSDPIPGDTARPSEPLRSPDAGSGSDEGRRAPGTDPDSAVSSGSGLEPDSAAPSRSAGAESAPAASPRSAGVEPGSAEDHRSLDAESEVAGEYRSSSDVGPQFAGGHRDPAIEPDDDLRDAPPTSGAAAAAARPGADGRDADDDFGDDFEDDASPMSEDAEAARRHDADAALADGPTIEYARSSQDDADDGGRYPEPASHGTSRITGAVHASEGDQPRHRDPGFERSSADHSSAVPPSDPLDLPQTAGVGEPDDDDPADEPPPQVVRPSDAVSVARMDAEVLVVDGRPRYHLGDCPHLAGRRAEPLPINEAVELGFSPCGECRPVDRLVAQAAYR